MDTFHAESKSEYQAQIVGYIIVLKSSFDSRDLPDSQKGMEPSIIGAYEN